MIARWVFLRLLGLTYLIAFVSLWTQIDGLIGQHGILPAQDFLRAVAKNFGASRLWIFPTFCWLNPTDAMLHGLCAAGVILALLLILDVAPPLALLGLWAAYLSLATVGQDFLEFQWDILLLETGFLAIFFAPLRFGLKRGDDAPPPRLALWLLWFLLFKLTFSSGVVKLASGDPTWRNLTALQYHYETQPLPTWIGWYAHQLPAWFQQVSVVIMFATELAAPFTIFCPRPIRLTGCAAMIGFQLLIALTGNYCFFNLLTIALCLLLLERDVSGAQRRPVPIGDRSRLNPRHVPLWLIGASLFFLSALQLAGTLRVPIYRIPSLAAIDRAIAPFRTINSYGLFAVMTTVRPEILIEGSHDGQTWQAYEFKYKPGDLTRRPAFVAPHQPRLDWQMWFAALSNVRQHLWFLNFCARLLEGSPEVLKLLAHNPFPDAPPKYLRATVYQYHFTDVATRRKTGEWWRREEQGRYIPVLSLREP